MTGWHLRGGYSSAFSAATVDEMLCRIVEETRRDTKGLMSEAGQEASVLTSYLAHYAEYQDATITRREDDGRVEFMLLASGGGASRDLKEQARRVFCRVVMRRMHEKHLDVSLVVA